MAVKKQPPTKPRAVAQPRMPRVAAREDDVEKLIAEAAYYRAQQRGFAPGHELEDWVAAEAEVRRGLQR